MEKEKVQEDILGNMLNNKLELVTKAKNAYYNSGNPILSDAEYDKLVAEVGYESVGAPVLDSLKKINISDRPMLSLAKCHSTEEIKSFAQDQDLVASIKCDGLSVRIIYENGKLVSANTRGDSIVGQDITEHIKQFKNVPLVVNYKGRLVVDGEAIIFQHDFDEINTGGEFKNPRNLAAGTLASLDTSLCTSRRLSFIAWDLIEPRMDFYNAGLNYLEDEFDIVPWQYCLASNDNFTYENINNRISKIAKEKGIPCDGVVWKYNFNGYNTERTSHHWSNAIAWKPAMTVYNTRLKTIEWTMGRTGQLTPIAVFDEVDDGESKIKKASLHNYSIMKETLGLCAYVGEPLQVFKANAIIPQVVQVPKEHQFDYGAVISHGGAPANDEIEHCPVCGGEIEIKESDTGVKTVWCANPLCEGKLINRLDHFCGKKGLDIKGLSKATLEKLIDWGWVGNIQELYSLENFKEEWAKKQGFGKKSVENILTAIENSKDCELHSFISAIGIPLIGKTASKEIAKKTKTWEAFIEKIESKFDFSSWDSFGPEMKSSLLDFDYSEAKYIYDNYLDISQEEVLEKSDSLSGLTIVITGSLNEFKNRSELQKKIEDLGGKTSSSVSGKTSYLICNNKESATGKTKTAKERNIPILTEKEFIEKFLQL